MRPDTCKHFNGIQNGKCVADVPYDQFRVEGRSMLAALPCFERNNHLTCAHCEWPSSAELAAYEAETEKLMANVLELDRLIGQRSQGSFPCKVCGEGTVTYKIVGPLQGVASCSKCDWRMVS